MSKLRYTKILVISFIALAVFAVASLTLSILISEKVFSTKLNFRAKFSDATGLKGNVPVIFKGFKIGYLNNLTLGADNNIYADLNIYEDYRNLIRDNCILYKNVNFITSVTNILLLTGTGKSKLLEQGSMIPGFDTREGKAMQRLHNVEYQGEVINAFMFKIEAFLDEVNPQISPGAGEANSGIMNSLKSIDSTFGKINSIITNVDKTVAMVKDGLSGSKSGVFGGMAQLDNLMSELVATTKNARGLMGRLDATLVNYQRPDSLAIKMIDPTGDNFLKPVKTSLNSINELLPEINKLLVYSNDQTTNLSLIQEKIKKVLDDLQVTLQIINKNPIINFGTNINNKKVEQGKKRPR
ncbi:MAG: MCE family protein [Ignavibacteria bacterium]|nr:MCE family protein [Ignavibacteria bacterium]